MKKSARLLFYISIVVFMYCGGFFAVQEFMPDVSVVPRKLDTAMAVVGSAALLYAAVYYFIDTQNKKKKNRPKLRR